MRNAAHTAAVQYDRCGKVVLMVEATQITSASVELGCGWGSGSVARLANPGCGDQ